MNGRQSKDKGYRGEIEACETLSPVYPEAARYGGINGKNDKGDVKNVGPWAIQVKNVARENLGRWVADAEKQAKAAGKPWAAVMVKLRGKHMRRGVFVMSNEQAVQILRQLESCTCREGSKAQG